MIYSISVGQEKLIRFLSLWITNSLVLNIASLIFRNNIVLGTDKVSMSMAAVLSGIALTALSYAVPKLVAKVDFKMKSEYYWQGIFFAANAIVIWVIKRFALITGLGISNNLYVLLIALILTLVQWKVLKTLAFLMSKK